MHHGAKPCARFLRALRLRSQRMSASVGLIEGEGLLLAEESPLLRFLSDSWTRACQANNHISGRCAVGDMGLPRDG